MQKKHIIFIAIAAVVVLGIVLTAVLLTRSGDAPGTGGNNGSATTTAQGNNANQTRPGDGAGNEPGNNGTAYDPFEFPTGPTQAVTEGREYRSPNNISVERQGESGDGSADAGMGIPAGGADFCR